MKKVAEALLKTTKAISELNAKFNEHEQRLEAMHQQSKNTVAPFVLNRQKGAYRYTQSSLLTEPSTWITPVTVSSDVCHM